MATIKHSRVNGKPVWIVWAGASPVGQFDFLTEAQIFALTNYGGLTVEADV
jgi:hypothetical protein